MEQIANYVTGFFQDEILRSKFLTWCYVLFAGIFQVTKADFMWWLTAVVGVLAAANYIDQMIQRRKTKKQK